MKRSLDNWNLYLIDQVEKRKLSRNVFTPNQHYLNHLPAMITKLGPPIGYSTRCLERTIGVYKGRLQSTIDPGVEASNELVILGAINHRKVMGQHLNDEATRDECMISGKVTTTTALSPTVIEAIGADQHDVIRIGTKLTLKGTTYSSTNADRQSTRVDNMIALKVNVQR
jgi:hypothetical protein